MTHWHSKEPSLIQRCAVMLKLFEIVARHEIAPLAHGI